VTTTFKNRLIGPGGWYIRVSGDEQDTESQRQAVERWLSHHGLSVVPQFRFEDDGFERDRPEERPEFMRMLRCAEAGLVKWIVADRQDRFGTKNKHQFIYYMHLLREAGCEFITTDGKVWTDDNLTTFFEGGMGAETSEKEQKEKSHRTLRGKISKAKKGEYQGGHIAFGMDVVCFDASGMEKWRVVIDGRKLVATKPGKGGKKRRVYSLRRLKVTPGGNTEVFEGHRTFPASETTDTLEVRPSNDKTRLDAVVEVFKKSAEEATCPTVLANYLNTLGIKPYYAERWEHYHVREMLKNPIYTGRQRWNSHGQGRFHEFVGSVEQVVKNPSGGRIRSQDDWVLSDRQLFAPVVPLDVWETVQDKLKKEPPKRRSPRSPDLWFAGLVYCANCGQPMRGMQRPTRSEYFCTTYAKNKKNGTCLRHAVNHKEVEEHVQRFLTEAGREAAVMLEAQRTGNTALLKPYEEKHKAVFTDCMGPLVKIMATLARDKGEGGEFFKQWVAANTKLDDTGPPSQNMQQVADEFVGLFQPLQQMYDLLFTRNSAVVRQRLAAVQAEHRKLTKNVLNLDPTVAKRAIQQANEEIGELEQEMERLEGDLVNYSEVFDRRNAELRAVSTAFDTAEAALNDPAASNRRKANAVRACIQQIDLTFQPTGKKYPKSELVKVEIIPVEQPGPEYPNGASSCKARSPRPRRSCGRPPRPGA
jgi:DNA invertase Pin-like site-specific DNA recombinase